MHNLHPDKVLFDSDKTPTILPGCEHIAGNPKFLKKALGLQKEFKGSFDVTCDFEDGSPADDITNHANSMLAILKEANTDYRVGIRLPDRDNNSWTKVLEIVLKQYGNKLAYLTLPKVRSRTQLDQLILEIDQRCSSMSISQSIPLHILIETLTVLKDLDPIASHSRVECLDFGIMDFISEHMGVISADCMKSPGQFEHELLKDVKTNLVKSAVRNNCVASHNVTIAYSDKSRTFNDAKIARNQFGFTRMWSIHPDQIQEILNAMSPDSEQLEHAKTVLINGFTNNWAPIAVAGQLYDRASFRYYWQICKIAKANGREIPLELNQFLK